MFHDRADAGRKLAQVLMGYQDKDAVIFALPRGGVVLGAEVARALHLPLDLILVRKIGHPLSPEYAIAAVAEDGYLVSNPNETFSVDERWLDAAVEEQLAEARRRRRAYLGDQRPVDVEGRTAIIIDDGLATGLTMKAAIHELRRRNPRRIIVAVPVAARETVDELRSEVDELVVLSIPQPFGAIGAFYELFDQVEDAEVTAIMDSMSEAAVDGTRTYA